METSFRGEIGARLRSIKMVTIYSDRRRHWGCATGGAKLVYAGGQTIIAIGCAYSTTVPRAVKHKYKIY